MIRWKRYTRLQTADATGRDNESDHRPTLEPNGPRDDHSYSLSIPDEGLAHPSQLQNNRLEFLEIREVWISRIERVTVVVNRRSRQVDRIRVG